MERLEKPGASNTFLTELTDTSDGFSFGYIVDHDRWAHPRGRRATAEKMRQRRRSEATGRRAPTLPAPGRAKSRK